MTAWIRTVEVSCATSDTSKTVTGLPSTPKGYIAIIAAGRSVQTRPSHSIGWSDGTSQFAQAVRGFAGTPDSPNTIHRNTAFGMTWNGTTERLFTHTAMTGDGLTFGISGTLQGTTVVTLIVFGGTAVSVDVHGLANQTNGTKTRSGLAFAPTLLFGMFSQVGGGPNFGSFLTQGAPSVYVFDGTTQRAHVGVSVGSANPTNTGSAARTGNPFTIDTSGALIANVSTVTLTGDGYTWAQSNASGMTSLWFALAGISGKVLTTTVQAATGTVALTGAGFEPTGAVVIASTQATSATLAAPAHLSIGVQSLTSGYSTVALNENSINPANPDVQRKASAVVFGLERTASNTFSDRSVASIASYDSDGLTLDWTDADATAGLVTVVALRASSDAGSRLVSPAFYHCH